MGTAHLLLCPISLLANHVDVRNPLRHLCEQAPRLRGSQFPSLAYEDNLALPSCLTLPKRDSTPVIRLTEFGIHLLLGLDNVD